jgi:hypothetical protein
LTTWRGDSAFDRDTLVVTFAWPAARSNRPRLDPAIFHLPVEKMREGYYSDKYFVRARGVLLADKHRPRVTMQVFGKARAFLGGVDEAIAILKLCSQGWEELEVSALHWRRQIEPWETVLLIEGPTTRSRTSRRSTSACWPAAPGWGRTPAASSKPPGRKRSSSFRPGVLAGVQTGDSTPRTSRSHRRLDRRAGLLVGIRGWAPCRALIAAYGLDRARVEKFVERMPGTRRLIHSSISNVRRHVARGGARAGRAALRRAARHVGDAR